MSLAIKLNNDTYIDASGVYDVSLHKTILQINPTISTIGKVISSWDDYILPFWLNKDLAYAPQFDYIDIGGPIIGCIWMKHSNYYGGSMIVMSYQTSRPIFYRFFDSQIVDEYYL